MNDAAQELIGRTVGGRFRLTGFLGEGAMATVFRGEQDGEPRDVAVKIMHQELLRDATFAKRFTREAKAAARIVHPSSVRIVEHGADGNLLYLAMELLVGQDLFDVLARERRLPEARAARILLQVCGALGAAHAHGIVHRDLKPENVMILPDPDDPSADRVKVLDFGIAKILERGTADDEPPRSEGSPGSGPVSSAPPSSVLTMVGGLVGTPEYMSPEQATGMQVDVRSDLYSCGALLYHLVTGRPPFKSDHVVEVLMAHADKPPPAPSTLVPDIHPGLERVILKALSKRPTSRHQTAAELAAELDALLPELSTSQPVPKASPSSREAAAPGSKGPPSPPGVPTSVAITTPSEPPPPPETLRSPPPASDPVPGTPLTLPEDDSLPYERTLALEPPSAPPETVKLPDPPSYEKTLVLDPQPAPVTMGDPGNVPQSPPAPVKSAAAFAKTLPIEDAPLPLDRTLALDAPAPLSKTLALAPASEPPEVAATDPVDEPAPPSPRTAAVAPAGDRWIAPWWVFVLAVAILSAVIWAMRYARLGAGD